MSGKRSREWRSHPNLPDYEVSEYGEVRRITRARTRFAGHVVKGHRRGIAGNGHYWAYKLAAPEGKQTFWAHRLVAECFLGKQPSPAHIIAHADGNPLNNHFSNLRWATAAENGADTARHGSLKGTCNPRAILTDSLVKEIRARYTGAYGEQSRLAREYGMSRSAFRSVITGDHWRHV